MIISNAYLNIDFFIVGIAVASNLILGFLIFFRDTKSATSRLFLAQTVILSVWSVLNYLSYTITNLALALWIERLVMFFAIPNSIIFLFLMHTFPNPNFLMKRESTIVLCSLGIFAMGVAVSPLLLPAVEVVPGVITPQPIIGPGMIAFVPAAVFTILIGLYLLIRNFIRSTGIHRQQLKYILIGVFFMFSFILIFNFILPSTFQNTRFIPLSASFTLPFIIATALAIIRHKLLNIKIISTEILVFILAITTLFELLISTSAWVLLFRALILVLVLIFGILLIKSVLHEIRQREELQVLTTKLGGANRKLTELDQARAEFISIASHQLRTPPATIKWYLGAILSGDYGVLNPSLKSALEKTERTNNSLIALIEDILNVSRIERGKLEFLFEPVNVLELADTTFEQLYPLAKEKGLLLAFDRPINPLPAIMADREKLRQVMNNLIDNAIKYTRQGKITAKLFEQKGSIYFSVSDTGIGIDPAEHDEIFQKYKRGDHSLGHSTGLGLGLYVAKVIISEHKGKIWAESAGKDKGSTFTFMIPIKNNLKKTTLFDLVHDSPEKSKVNDQAK